MSDRRLLALAALVLGIASAALAVGVGIAEFPRGLSVLALIVLAVLCVWYGIRRRGAARRAGVAAAAALLVFALVVVVIEGRPLANLLVLVAAAGSLAAARVAFKMHVALPRATPPSHPVLFYNPLSGGGKAERFHVADEAQRRGIEPVQLRHGDDLEVLVRDAVERGADGLAMAGGDGSQAIVAKIAAELDLPYACIPAGTRNHFALDLGVDRDDVVGALDALVDGGERHVDLAEVNGTVFVNNVSLGLYAEAVQRPEYRGAKLHTLLDSVPDALGPDARPQDLNWSGSGGRESAVAILVSNNRYRLGRALGSGTRPRLDDGVLGIAVLGQSAEDPNGGHGLAVRQWTDQTFEVDSGDAVPAGIDGEAVVLDPPLRFRIREGVLRVRVSPKHPGASPSVAVPDSLGQAIAELVKLAFGTGKRE